MRLLELAADGIFTWGPGREITWWSPGAERIFGYRADEAVGKAVPDLLDPKYPGPEEEILRTLLAEGHWEGETSYRRKDGEEVPTSSRWTLLRDEQGGLRSVLQIDTDITERRRAEEENAQYRQDLEELVAERGDELAASERALAKETAERERAEAQLREIRDRLRHSRRMEAVARLAGGIAHDFNNLLTVVSGYCDLLKGRLDPLDPNRQAVDQIGRSAERAAALTHQLLALGGRQSLRPEAVKLDTLLRSMEETLRRLAGKEVELVLSTDSGLGTVRVDPGRIEQVVVDLVANARDAMPGGGRITIETRNVEFDDDAAHFHFDIRPGPYVLLSISDTGCGMDEAARSRVFEPFFRATEEGRETGLGLSAVYGTVRQSGGHIWVYSEPGKGTTFKLHFPRESAEGGLEAGEGPEAPGGGETVLLVDDEADVRELIGEMLRLQGFSVLEAADGEEALRLVEGRREPVRALVTDVAMAGMNGAEVADRLRRLHPDVKVLFISGSTEAAALRQGGLETGTDFLSKPFTREALARKMTQLLRERGRRDRVA